MELPHLVENGLRSQPRLCDRLDLHEAPQKGLQLHLRYEFSRPLCNDEEIAAGQPSKR